MRGATGRLPAAAPQARLATPRDRSVVRQLECACFGWARWLLGLWPQTGRVGVLGLIAEAGGAPGGYLLAYPLSLLGRTEMYIGGVGVAPELRRRGLAYLLIEETLRAHPRLWLHARVSNAAAIALYRRFGFREAARIPGFYGNGETALALANFDPGGSYAIKIASGVRGEL